MSPTKPRNPDTITYDDHLVIVPDNESLRQSLVPAAPHDPDPIARAEQALAGLSEDFAKWMAEDCARLDMVRSQLKAAGINPKNRETMLRAVEDIKGNAPTLGFHEAAPVADSLGRLLEHSPDLTRIPLELIDQHVNAVKAIVREHDRKDVAAIAAVLISRLRQVTEEFLIQENRHRPEYLQAAASPQLAPGDSS